MDEESLKELKRISKQLNVIVALLLEISSEGGKKTTNRDRILSLYSFGLRPVEIATILNKTSTYINKELAINKERRINK